MRPLATWQVTYVYVSIYIKIKSMQASALISMSEWLTLALQDPNLLLLKWIDLWEPL